MAKRTWPTAEKSKKILVDGKIRGKPLTPGQKALFQGLAHGWKPSGKRSKRRSQRGGRGGTRTSYA